MNGTRTKTKGCLYLIPNTLGQTGTNTTIPEHTLDILRRLQVLVVENIQSARRYLQWVGQTVPEYEILFYVLNKDTDFRDITDFLKPALEGSDIGLLSEAGCPAVADPGSLLVREAHRRHIRVIPLTGPNSMLLALMASGFNGQSFAFWGYLPVKDAQRKEMIEQLEKESRKQNRSQIFMEVPHRNQELLSALLDVCDIDTCLCIATDLTLDTESILSLTVKEWKKHPLPDLQKRPTIFILYAGEILSPSKTVRSKQR